MELGLELGIELKLEFGFDLESGFVFGLGFGIRFGFGLELAIGLGVSVCVPSQALREKDMLKRLKLLGLELLGVMFLWKLLVFVDVCGFSSFVVLISVFLVSVFFVSAFLVSVFFVSVFLVSMFLVVVFVVAFGEEVTVLLSLWLLSLLLSPSL
jgi:hypothetical protein